MNKVIIMYRFLLENKFSFFWDRSPKSVGHVIAVWLIFLTKMTNCFLE